MLFLPLFQNIFVKMFCYNHEQTVPRRVLFENKCIQIPWRTIETKGGGFKYFLIIPYPNICNGIYISEVIFMRADKKVYIFLLLLFLKPIVNNRYLDVIQKTFK